MKIKTLKNKKRTLVELNLIKWARIEKKCKSYHVSLLTTGLEHHINFTLKNALKIIYTYHVSNFKILFLGVPVKNKIFLKRLCYQTDHIYIPDKIKFKDAREKKYLLKRFLKTKNRPTLSVKIKNKLKKPKLIVFMGNFITKPLLNEIYNMRVPFVYFNTKIQNQIEAPTNEQSFIIKHKSIWRFILSSLFSRSKFLKSWKRKNTNNFKRARKTK